MAVYIKGLTMIDAAGFQATARDQIPVLNTDDPAAIALTVGAGAATAIPAGLLYLGVSTEETVVFLRVGTANNQLAGATHVPVPPNGVPFWFRVGAGVTHIHAGAA
jgi:hypothetical protein